MLVFSLQEQTAVPDRAFISMLAVISADRHDVNLWMPFSGQCDLLERVITNSLLGKMLDVLSDSGL